MDVHNARSGRQPPDGRGVKIARLIAKRLASKSKCLAQNDKSPERCTATKKCANEWDRQGVDALTNRQGRRED